LHEGHELSVQQRPSTQLPDKQSDPVEQRAPSAFFPHEFIASQALPAAHCPPVAVQDV
jgi:hypothetical protein